MPLTIRRYGGLMARTPKTRTVPLQDLDALTQSALETFLAKRQEPPVHTPDGFVYTFELDEGAHPGRSVAVAGHAVPDPLRKLLP
ncbi:MAG TPA: protealysin inhibitor emfourin [Rhodopila sp.]|uniref:protealysin inhibitor emfourin n=1 Tax=Rhodopila sp. TaxID=2480087 RepID=UPI002B536BA0|nr:protealysin inhibitor emfourin [Rhodopila sp.]HVY17948.1 protealysin inhibitor emfourin [Rhodopila sp.]